MPTHPDLFGRATLATHTDAVTAAARLVAERWAGPAGPRSTASPARLRGLVDGVDLDAAPVDLATALTEVADLYLDHAVRFDHPMSMAHLNCPVAIPTLAAEVLATAVNTSVDSWDQSTSATLVETRLVEWAARRIGFDATPGGVFTSGGTASNTHALALARELAGRAGTPLAAMRVLASDQAHFSVRTAARLLGLGADHPERAVVTVASDARGRLDPRALAAALTATGSCGEVPICVVATAGTTDLGAVDPIDRVADVLRADAVGPTGGVRCRLHVDAAYGGGLLVSPTRRHRLAGIERADTVTVDFHKSFFQPVACSALVARDRADLRALAHHADYLNPAGSTVPNLVDVSLQTSRRFDALKLWTTLRTLGADRVGRLFDTCIDLAADAARLAADRPDLEVAAAPELSTLLFRYRPAGITDTDADRLVPQVRAALFDSGQVLLASTRLRGRAWLKITLLDPATGTEHLAAMFDQVAATGAALVAAAQAVEAVPAR